MHLVLNTSNRKIEYSMNFKELSKILDASRKRFPNAFDKAKQYLDAISKLDREGTDVPEVILKDYPDVTREDYWINFPPHGLMGVNVIPNSVEDLVSMLSIIAEEGSYTELGGGYRAALGKANEDITITLSFSDRDKARADIIVLKGKYQQLIHLDQEGMDDCFTWYVPKDNYFCFDAEWGTCDYTPNPDELEFSDNCEEAYGELEEPFEQFMD